MVQLVVNKMAPVDRRGLLSQPQCLTARSGSGREDLRRPEPIMSVPRSVAEVIQNHVTLEVEGIDRMYLNVYQPKLQTEKQAACFFRYHRKQPVASSSLMGVMTNAFLQQVDAFVEEHQIPVVPFRKG